MTDKPTEQEVWNQLAMLKRVCEACVSSTEAERKRAIGEAKKWFRQNSIPIREEGDSYVLVYPYRRTLEQICADESFSYAVLARRAGVDVSVVADMLVNIPVAANDAEKILAELNGLIEGGPYNLSTVKVVVKALPIQIYKDAVYELLQKHPEGLRISELEAETGYDLEVTIAVSHLMIERKIEVADDIGFHAAYRYVVSDSG